MDRIDPAAFAQLQAEVAALRSAVAGRATVRAPGSEPGTGTPSPSRSRRRRAAAALALTALVIAMPVLVSASHQFTDVPTTNSFHTAISNLYGARLTTGCSTGRFCPSDAVTRGQVAAFLNRSLGRGAADASFASDDWAELADLTAAEVTLRTGGATGGTAHVWVHGGLSAWTDENGICPCEIELWLSNDQTLDVSFSAFEIIGSEAVGGYRDGSLSVSYLFAVPSGQDVTYSLHAEITSLLPPSPENDAGFGYDLTAIYLPFDADGGNPALPIATSGEGGRRSR